MEKIKFSIDGWKAVIAKDFTLANVAKIAYATAQWLTRKYKNPSAIVGYDCRFGGEMFMEAVAKILASKEIRVYIPDKFVSTPMVSLGVIKLKANCGIIITAGHNPAEYSGFKLRGDFGGPMLEKDLREIEYLLNDSYEIDLEMLNWNHMQEQGLIQYIDLETIYIKQIKDSFEVEKINELSKKFAFDAMYGSGQNVFKKILPKIKRFHCEVNPIFKGVPPNPVHKNLHELSEYVWRNKEIKSGLAIDGDGSRIAMYDEKGNFIDSNKLLLLLIHYLSGYKNQTGKVVVAFSSTSKVEKLCKHYELEVERVKIGFNNVTKLIITDDILIGGEDPDGIAIGRHIPGRDSLWTGLLIWQWMIETGKNLIKLLEEVYAITGVFALNRQEIELSSNVRNKIIEKCNYFIWKIFSKKSRKS